MNNNLGKAVRWLAVFMTVCLAGLFALIAAFGELRFDPSHTYDAEFHNVSGLEGGNFVRIAGVEVGKVSDIRLRRDGTAVVTFTADDTVVLTHGTRAVIRYSDLVGGRYLALEEGAGDTTRLAPGQTIPVAQTAPALDLDALIGGFRPLFRALDPDQVNTPTGELIQAFQGQGSTVTSLLRHTAEFSHRLADRDELIAAVITNLDTVLGSLSAQSMQFDKAVSALSQLVSGLAQRGPEIASSIAATNAAAVTVTDLLARARTPFKDVVAQTDRVAAIAVADKDYLENFLDTLPDAYRMLGRQGLYGDFFTFYLCDLSLKVNGQGGQPTYIKLAGQDTGRCAPK
ncbi:mammalian cell entry protein [Mycobacterium sp. MS1601]|uniref:MCE family protein n=1 Tax=Mycobacterium sp. MS1601 TaxID=1936029 RepID=UPI0009797F1E|nr:MCE family protein [Mycobacterium sp. MS1601]AQA05446.1 mammalian cell entry protein [Mycobacterium sp. MS1601]